MICVICFFLVNYYTFLLACGLRLLEAVERDIIDEVRRLLDIGVSPFWENLSVMMNTIMILRSYIYMLL